MPTDADIQVHLAQLARYRALVLQHSQQGLPDDAVIQATYKGIAACKELLRAWGVRVADQAEDGPTEVGARVEIHTIHNSGAQGVFYGSVQINNGTTVNLHALLHDHTGFMCDRLASFVGRVEELCEVRRRVAELLPTGGYVSITGQAGQGKSSLIAKLVELTLREHSGVERLLGITQLVQQAGPAALAYHFIPLSPGPDHQVGLLRNLMARLILKYDLPDIYLATDSRPALRDYFARALEDIAAKGGQEVIYIDGLDQIEEDVNGVRDLSFLPTRPPAGIAFVLGTRPNDTLQPLALRKPHQEYRLPPLSRADFDLVLRHRQITLDPHQADRFYSMMEANALYLDLVARELVEAGALAPEQIIARIADNPDNLFSLAIERLKRPALEWRTVIKPILGALLAAREPLTVVSLRIIIGQEDEAVRTGLIRLGGLLDRDGQGRYTLYHLKLRDFLREEPQHQDKGHVFATDEEQGCHQKLADWCERGGLACIWQDCTGSSGEQERRVYARKHYLAHLCRAQNWPRLWEVLDQGEYGKAKLRHDPSTRSFVLDLDMVRQAMAADRQHTDSADWLVRFWKYSLLRCSLSNQVDSYPDGLIELFAMLGREQEAIGLVELLTDLKRKVSTCVQIGLAAATVGKQAIAQQMIERAYEAARTESNSEERSQLLKYIVVVVANAGMLKHAKELACRFENRFTRAWSLGRVAEALAQTGEVVEAEELARTIEEREPQAQALRAVAVALVQAGKIRAAKRLAASAGNLQLRAWMHHDIAQTLVQIGQAERAEKLARSIWMLEAAEIEFWTLGTIAHELARRKQWSKAAALARSIAGAELQLWPLVEVAQELARASQWTEAKALARSIADEEVQAQALATVAAALAQASRWAEAEALARSIADQQMQALALTAVAAALAQASRWAEAEALARSIADEQMQALALAAVATTLVQASQWTEAEALARSIADKETQALALVAIVRALAEAGRWTEAETLARSMRNSRQQALQTVAEALTRSGQVASAAELAASIDDDLFQMDTLGLVVKTLIETDKIAEAERLTASFDSEWMQARSMAVIAQALFQSGHKDAALTRAEQSARLARTLDGAYAQMKALESIIEVFIRLGQTDMAYHLIGLFQDMYQRDVLLRSAVTWLVEMGDVHAAEELTRSISEPAEHSAALLALAKSWAKAHNQDKAKAHVAAAVSTVQMIEDRQGQAEVLADLAEALASTGQWEEAESLAQSITIDWVREDGLRRVTEQAIQAYEWERADRLAHAIDDSWARASMLACLACGLAQSQHENAAKLYGQQAIQIARSIKDLRTRADGLGEVAGALAQGGLWELVDDLQDSLEEEGQEQDRVQQAIVSVVARTGEADEIEDLAHAMKYGTLPPGALGSVVRALADMGQWDRAAALARTARDPHRQADALREIAEALTRMQRWETAFTYLQEAVTLTDSLTRHVPMNQALTNTAAQLGACKSVLRFVWSQWGRATRRDDLYALLPVAAPLFVADPTLLPQILAGGDWVREQLKW